MAGQHMGFEGARLAVGALEGKPEFFALLDPAVPSIDGHNRTIDLHANGQLPLDHGVGQLFRGFPTGYCGPRDQHGVNFYRGKVRGKRELALDAPGVCPTYRQFHISQPPAMRDDYIKDALKVIPDANLLINVVSRRVKQLKRGNRPLVESLEKLTSEDVALREIIEGKISYDTGDN